MALFSTGDLLRPRPPAMRIYNQVIFFFSFFFFNKKQIIPAQVNYTSECSSIGEQVIR